MPIMNEIGRLCLASRCYYQDSMQTRLKRIVLAIQAAATLVTGTGVFAHGVDELPGPGGDIIVFLSVGWIIIALGVVFLIRRLIRRDAEKFKGRGRGNVNNTKEP